MPHLGKEICNNLGAYQTGIRYFKSTVSELSTQHAHQCLKM